MFTILNQYSYVLVSLFILTIAFLLAYRTFSIRIALLSVLILMVGVVFLQNSLTSPSDEIKDISGWDSLHNSGRPVLLYLYSDFRNGCLSMKPAVDRLEVQLGQKLIFVRLEVQSRVGKILYDKYDGKLVPTFIIFDQSGAIRHITNGVPDHSLINSMLADN